MIVPAEGFVYTVKCDRNIHKKSGRPADLSAACGLAALVKCFDRVNNLSNMALGFTRDRMAEYVEETDEESENNEEESRLL